LWAWAKEHLAVDLVIFTEASTPRLLTNLLILLPEPSRLHARLAT
jgi:hypothetical protein